MENTEEEVAEVLTNREKSNSHLISFGDRPKAERTAIARKGGLASVKVRQERATLRKNLLALMSAGKTQDNACLALVERAMGEGSVANEAFKIIENTIGEKPANININKNIDENNEYKDLTIEELKKLAGE